MRLLFFLTNFSWQLVFTQKKSEITLDGIDFIPHNYFFT